MLKKLHLVMTFGLFVVVPMAMVGCPSPEPAAPEDSGTEHEAVEPADESADTTSAEETEMVSLRIPSMTCPFACWPKVKETLEQQEGVAEVTLAEQAKEDAIDNPVVCVHVDGEFDTNAAIDALAKVNFGDASIEN